MSKIRLLNPKPLHDNTVMSMSWEAIVTWAYIPCFADKNGRMRDEPVDIRASMMPFKNFDMDKVLDELANKNHIIRYTVNNKNYLQIRNFLLYQRPYPKEPDGDLPPPPESNQQQLLSGPDSEESSRSLQEATSILVSDPISISRLKGVEKLIPDQSDYPGYNQESWSFALGVWESAGPWKTPKGEPENFRGAKKAFYRKISEKNWSEFIQKLDWAITASRSQERKWLGLFVTFIEEEKWKDVSCPVPLEIINSKQEARLNARWD